MSNTKNLARQISELNDPIPNDFDPEEEFDVSSEEEEDSEESTNELAGTEHYAPTGKSKLSRPEINLGAEYSGSKVRRQALEEAYEDTSEGDSLDKDSQSDRSAVFADPENSGSESNSEDGDIDSDEALGESDDQKFKNFMFRGSSKPRIAAAMGQTQAVEAISENEEDEEDGGVSLNNIDSSKDIARGTFSAAMEDSSASDDDPDKSDSSSHSDSNSSCSEDDAVVRRSELQKIMAEDQKLVLSSLTEAAKADATKWNAVKEQRKTFDSLLKVRMTLQKALVGINTMSCVAKKDRIDVINEPYEAAEEAAIKLWNTLDGLRHELLESNSTQTGQKRKRDAQLSTPSSSLWESMQQYELAFMNQRQITLEKWSAKVRGSTVIPVSQKVNPVNSHRSIVSVIQDQLVDPEQLINRTKIPRSCAPVQRDNKVVEDPDIYDDGIFYQMLLKDLVDQKRADSVNSPILLDSVKTTPWAAIKEARIKKVVDTKASKGRKMRYTVHEKLQNFMAPEDRSSWERAAIDRLFSTLLGQKITLSDEQNEDVDEEEDGLRLFRS